MILAQIENVPGDFLKNYALTGMGVLGIIYFLKEIFGGKKKREVSFEFAPASKDEFDRHVALNEKHHTDIFAKIGGVERGANSAIENKMQQVVNELTEQGKSIAGLEKETELQNQSIAAMQGDIKKLLERVPPRRIHE